MMARFLNAPLFCLIYSVTLWMPPAAQAQRDTTLRHIKAADVVPPVSLALAGLITQGRISRALQERVRESYPNFRTHADDFLLYAPGVVSLGLAASGVKGKHGLKDQLIIALVSNLAVQGVTQGMKAVIGYPRPNGEDYRSFPSGHSSSAFANATILHEEYGSRSVWYTVGGYGTATAVGTMRILNNKHWLADVLMGAGVGIGATKVIYISYPWVQRQVRRVRHR